MAVEIADSLVQASKVAKTINGYLIPKTPKSSDFSYLRLRNVYTCVIVDKEGKDVIAIAAVMRYSPSQAYCSLAEVDESVRNKLIRLDKACPFTLGGDSEGKENHSGAQVTKSRDGTRNTLRDPVYMIHYRHKGSSINYVTRVVKMTPQDLIAISDFDRQVSKVDRFEYLTFLSKLKGSQILAVRSVETNQEIVGFSITFDGTILCLYATSQEAAEMLLKASIAESNGKLVTMTVVSGSWIDNLCREHKEVLSCERPIHRYHTTGPPKQINWNYVHVLNSGIHIV